MKKEIIDIYKKLNPDEYTMIGEETIAKLAQHALDEKKPNILKEKGGNDFDLDVWIQMSWQVIFSIYLLKQIYNEFSNSSNKSIVYKEYEAKANKMGIEPLEKKKIEEIEEEIKN